MKISQKNAFFQKNKYNFIGGYENSENHHEHG